LNTQNKKNKAHRQVLRSPLYLGSADREQLEALCANRNTPRKVVWRAEIVLATAADKP